MQLGLINIFTSLSQCFEGLQKHGGVFVLFYMTLLDLVDDIFVSRGQTDVSVEPLAVVSLKRRSHMHDFVGRTCRCEGGLRTCFVSADNVQFGGDPCVNTHKYLQVDYRCLSETGMLYTRNFVDFRGSTTG